MRARCRFIVLTVVLSASTFLVSAAAQSTGSPGAYAVEFTDARRIAADPFGNIYVVDEGAGRLVRIGTDGRILSVGGRRSDLRFPAGIDATNGLAIYVADRAGRLFRYSREMALIGEVGPGALRGPLSARGESSEDVSRRGVGFEGDIAPADILVGQEGDIFFIDERQNHVVKLDDLYRFERRIGGYEAGSAALAKPVSMCMSREGALVVADARRGAIVRFDSYGSYLGERAIRDGGDIRTIRCLADAVIVTFEDRIDIIAGGDVTSVVQAPEGERLRDVLPRADSWLLLTSRRLIAIAVPENVEDLLDGDVAGR